MMIERVARLPALLIVTFRPEFQPPWSDQAHVTTLTLNRFAPSDAAALVASLGGNNALTQTMIDEIIERTDGVPLFVEELTKAVLEATGDGDGANMISAAPLPQLAIPASLHASLMARLDRLGPRAKRVAQVGAAIGREFSFDLLLSVSGIKAAELADDMASLTASNLIFQRRTGLDMTYIFKHALIRDAAYGTLLRGRRRALHASIAEALTERADETSGIRPELLAHHWTEAGRPTKALEYLVRAGESAIARAAHREASILFERAIAALTLEDGTSTDPAAVLRVRLQLHNAIFPIGELERDLTNLGEAERLAERLKDTARLIRVLAQQAYLLGSTGDLARAIAVGERALSLLNNCVDIDTTANAMLMLARTLYAAGRYKDAAGNARAAADLLGEDLSRSPDPSMNQTVSARVWLAVANAEMGNIEAGMREIEVATRLGKDPSLGLRQQERIWPAIGLGRLLLVSGRFDAAADTVAPVLPLCEGEWGIYFSRVASTLGAAYFELGRAQEGLELLRAAELQGGGDRLYVWSRSGAVAARFSVFGGWTNRSRAGSSSSRAGNGASLGRARQRGQSALSTWRTLRNIGRRRARQDRIRRSARNRETRPDASTHREMPVPPDQTFRLTTQPQQAASAATRILRVNASRSRSSPIEIAEAPLDIRKARANATFSDQDRGFARTAKSLDAARRPTAIPRGSHTAAGTWRFDLHPSYSVLDDFEAVRAHVVVIVGNVTRLCGCDRKIQTEVRFDDGISNWPSTAKGNSLTLWRSRPYACSDGSPRGSKGNATRTRDRPKRGCPRNCKRRVLCPHATGMGWSWEGGEER